MRRAYNAALDTFESLPKPRRARSAGDQARGARRDRVALAEEADMPVQVITVWFLLVCSPDEAQRNPGRCFKGRGFPRISASLQCGL
jgi:hypothetical protein